MTQFRNPYHFVPLGRETPPGRVPVSEFRRSDKREHAHITHDRWVAGTFSGRVTCTIETETPLIVANQQVARSHWTKLLKPFELTEGTPALPASALRGMISSISEAASHSALRVLKGDTLSFRRTMKDEKKLSALGLVVAGPDGTLHLRPLAMPTFIAGHDAYHPPEHFPIDIFPAPAFKVYLNPASSSYLSPNGSCTFKDGNGHSLRNATMSGTSLAARPRRRASKNRGGS